MRYWKRKVHKQFSLQELSLDDLFREETVTKGDFARFISMQGRVLHCNRDVCLLFKRIKNYIGGDVLRRD